MDERLRQLRERLDHLDAHLIERLVDRFRLAAEAAEVKSSAALGPRDRQRESQLLEGVRRRARSLGMDDALIESLYRGILEHSVRYQAGRGATPGSGASPTPAAIRVAYQGSDGAYSQIAARRHFAATGRDVAGQGHASFRETLDAVDRGSAEYAMLPIENTTAGSINEAYDLLAETSLVVVGEEVLRVDHCLVGLPGAAIDQIATVLSHPQALAQCSRYLARMPGCTAVAHADTAMAVDKIRHDDDPRQAAIASYEAAGIHGLQVLATGIANQPDNYTRFLVVAREATARVGDEPAKTSLVLVTRHQQGALARCLDVLASHGLNLTKLESRPIPKAPWEYMFYVDFEGHTDESAVADALRSVRACTRYLRILGSYPAALEARTDARPAAGAPAEAAAEARPAKIHRISPGPAAGARPAHTSRSYPLVARAARDGDTVVEIGSLAIGGPDPILIGGPCSVESAEQIALCAASVKKAGGNILRGGCFKPRTSPYSFQGLGFAGLELLANAGRAHGLPVVTEVLHPADAGAIAELADVLQIGARNTQNFALLRAVGDVRRPVLLKRGLMTTVDEWLAAAEYILERGNHEVILCERGIRTFERATRATLDLTVIPVVRERTHLPVIVDPSHAAGQRRWVAPLAQAAIAAGADGVMVEMHPKPDEALSDGDQSLTLPEFEALARALRGESSLEVAV